MTKSLTVQACWPPCLARHVLQGGPLTRHVCHGSDVEGALGNALRLHLSGPPGAGRAPCSPDLRQHALVLFLVALALSHVLFILGALIGGAQRVRFVPLLGLLSRLLCCLRVLLNSQVIGLGLTSIKEPLAGPLLDNRQ